MDGWAGVQVVHVVEHWRYVPSEREHEEGGWLQRRRRPQRSSCSVCGQSSDVGSKGPLARPSFDSGADVSCSELDVLMLGCMFPKYTSVTAKKSLKWVPLLGWFMALSKTVFIDRANRTSSRAAFDTAAHTMKTTRQNVFIFPEGTRSYASKPDLLPFKKGAFHLAVQAQVPIVPVVCANYYHVLDVKGKRFQPGVVDVSVLPPIQTKGLGVEHVDGLVKKTRDAMMDELIRLSHVSGTGNGEPLPRTSGIDGQERSELRKRN